MIYSTQKGLNVIGYICGHRLLLLFNILRVFRSVGANTTEPVLLAQWYSLRHQNGRPRVRTQMGDVLGTTIESVEIFRVIPPGVGKGVVSCRVIPAGVGTVSPTRERWASKPVVWGEYH